MTRQQVVDLIEEYRDTDGKSGLAAVNVASGLHSQLNPRGSSDAALPVAYSGRGF